MEEIGIAFSGIILQLHAADYDYRSLEPIPFNRCLKMGLSDSQCFTLYHPAQIIDYKHTLAIFTRYLANVNMTFFVLIQRFFGGTVRKL